MTQGLRASERFIDELTEHLRRCRCARGISQSEMDHRIGWADGYCAKIECGQRPLTLATLELLTAALDARTAILPPVPVEELARWENMARTGSGKRTPRPPRGCRSKEAASCTP